MKLAAQFGRRAGKHLINHWIAVLNGQRSADADRRHAADSGERRFPLDGIRKLVRPPESGVGVL